MGANFSRLSGGFLLGLALLLMMLPLPWLLSAVAAAAFHELCHDLAIRICCGQGGLLFLSASGARMTLPPMSRGREAICALAGPLGGLFLLLFARWIPRVALCAAFQSCFNLLPVYPLDGGRALQSLLSLVCSPPVCRILCTTLAVLCRILICILAFYGTFLLHLGVFPILMAGLLLQRGK